MNCQTCSTPKVSVYIPAYNAAEFLGSCIEALLAQSLPADEILVIDDGSRDDSAGIGRGYPGVTVIRHPVNKGLGAARNTAIRTARNELVASIDADCVAHPDWLAELAKNLSDSRVVGVGGKLTEGVQRTVADRWRAAHMPQHWGNYPIVNPRFLFGSNNLFRKTVVLDALGYNESMRTNGEDVDLCMRIRAKGWNVAYVPSALVTHMRHDTKRSILDAYWRWWRFGVNAYANGVRVRSVIGHAIFVHFRYNFLSALVQDFRAGHWDLCAFDFLLLGYLPYRDLQLWWKAKSSPSGSI
jgi:glycosyltransferase involved in cell wall biosynthesis